MTEIERIDQLREELHRHNYNYYVLNAPEITDQEFDKLMRELQDLEEKHPEHRDENSPSMRVGSDINKNFTQVVHKYPMLSLANTYSETEVTEFYDRVKKSLNEDFEICCEMKYDGTSISLTYENGKLVRAVTRGDGVQGDDVTGNVKTIRSIPLVLHGKGYPETFEIRGEILMPWVVFEELNKEREAREEPLFANPRNAASGTLKLQNSAIVASRKLDAYLYYLLGDNLPCDGHYENLKEAEKWGFKISDLTRKCKTLQEVFDFIKYWDVERKNLPVATDGIVLKVNSLRQQRNLGFTAKSPVVVVEKVRPRAPLLGDKTVSVVVVILRHTAGGLRLAKPAEEVGEIYGRAADNGAAKFGTCASPCEVVRPPVLIYGGKPGRAAVVLQA